jgi:hypothetical protein
MIDVCKGASAMIIALGFGLLLLWAGRSEHFMENVVLITVMLFMLPMILPWPRWWLGGVLVAVICFCILYGVPFHANRQPHHDSGVGAAIGNACAAMWTYAFGFGVFGRLAFREFLFLRRRYIVKRTNEG